MHHPSYRWYAFLISSIVLGTVDSSSLRLTEHSVQSGHHCFTQKVKSRGDIESGPKVLLGLIMLTKGVLIARLD